LPIAAVGTTARGTRGGKEHGGDCHDVEKLHCDFHISFFLIVSFFMNIVTISFVEGCLNFIALDREIFFKWISRDIAGTLFFKKSRFKSLSSSWEFMVGTETDLWFG